MTTTWPAQVNNGVTTSWIPFVTPGFSASPSCSAQMYIVPGSSPIVAFDPWQQINIGFQLQCLPAEVIEYWSQSQSANPTLTSRLGPMHCPSMYTTHRRVFLTRSALLLFAVHRKLEAFEFVSPVLTRPGSMVYYPEQLNYVSLPSQLDPSPRKVWFSLVRSGFHGLLLPSPQLERQSQEPTSMDIFSGL